MADPTAPTPAAAPAATPAAPAPEPLTGLRALAVFQDIAGKEALAADPKAAGTAPADGAAPAATAATSEPAKELEKPAEPPKDPLSRGFAKLARERASFQEQTKGHQERLTRADQLERAFQAVAEQPELALELFGEDFHEKLTLKLSGRKPDPPTEAERLATLEQARKDDQKRAEDEAARMSRQQQDATIARGLANVTGHLEKANTDGRFEATIALGRQEQVFDALAIYCEKHKIAPTVEMILAVGDEVEKQALDEHAGVVEKVPKLRKRFAPTAPATPPAPAAAAEPVKVTPKAEPEGAQGTSAINLTSKVASDVPPPAPKGRRSLKATDDEIAAKFWPG